MARYLVTGGAGFIGSHLAEALLRRGEQVRILDNFETGHRANLTGLGGAELIEGDAADVSVAARAVDGVDYVLHQAAIPSVPRSVAEPVAAHRANLDATLAVLEAARAAGVRRLVYAGSSAVYGDAPTLPKHEELAADPRSPYALQKLAGEQYLKLYGDLHGFESTTIRYFNVFGPRQDPTSPYSGVISLFITALVRGRRPVIYGDGEQTRDFTYVTDVVDGVLAACHAPAAGGRIINVATGARVSLNRLFTALKALIGSDVEPTFEAARVGDVRDSQADISRARALLGYAPKVTLEDGLRQTLEWYREHDR